jgi:hypothetical protein
VCAELRQNCVAERNEVNEAYLELQERQARRGLGLLPDRAGNAARHGRDLQRRRVLALEFGTWVATAQGPWDWFINPISFRDRHPDLEANSKASEWRSYRCLDNGLISRVFDADPSLDEWKPDYRGRRETGPPVPDKALAEINSYLFDLQIAADKPIRAMIAEEFGRIGGRYHAHALVAGVAHLRRDVWWKEAFRRFGRTRISPFDPSQGGAFYAAKYASKQLGALHFFGPMPGVALAAVIKPGGPVGGVDVLRSAEMSRDAIRRSEFLPRGWSNWRSKR